MRAGTFWISISVAVSGLLIVGCGQKNFQSIARLTNEMKSCELAQPIVLSSTDLLQTSVKLKNVKFSVAPRSVQLPSGDYSIYLAARPVGNVLPAQTNLLGFMVSTSAKSGAVGMASVGIDLTGSAPEGEGEYFTTTEGEKPSDYNFSLYAKTHSGQLVSLSVAIPIELRDESRVDGSKPSGEYETLCVVSAEQEL
jgi:hypothetical protein